ncbi:MAG: ATP-binding protein [Micromonosporaceae bacterium]|nr:ATP-binding protein [Micromonosporaceae bacterium]
MGDALVVAERAWSVVVPHQARGARVARHRLATELAGAVNPELVADAAVVVGELVGNSVRHARPLPGNTVLIRLRVRAEAGRQYLELRVTDGGGAPGRPRLCTAGPDAVNGRGLTIVAALADRWGVEQDADEQCVWAQLSFPSARPNGWHAPSQSASGPVPDGYAVDGTGAG